MTDRPHFLILMVDQLTGTFWDDGPADFLDVPHLRALHARSINFSSCYTPSPLCTPARGSFMTGLLPSGTTVYDNAAEFPSNLPTWAHYLRRAGWYTALSGKMHFVGADQLHGFEDRLTTDIYPADFGWTPDWDAPFERVDWWYHNLSSVTEAGVALTSNQLEYDDEVAWFARQKLLQLARRTDPDRPFCLCASFTHPHDPYTARPEQWARYEGVDIPMPAVGELPPESATRTRGASTTRSTRRASRSPRTTCAPRAAPTARTCPTWTTGSASCWARSRRRASPTTPSSCSAPTTATCSASGGSGTR